MIWVHKQVFVLTQLPLRHQVGPHILHCDAIVLFKWQLKSCGLQVQAHVAQTDVDPGAAVAWLRITDDGLQASPVSTQLMR